MCVCVCVCVCVSRTSRIALDDGGVAKPTVSTGSDEGVPVCVYVCVCVCVCVCGYVSMSF